MPHSQSVRETLLAEHDWTLISVAAHAIRKPKHVPVNVTDSGEQEDGLGQRAEDEDWNQFWMLVLEMKTGG